MVRIRRGFSKISTRSLIVRHDSYYRHQDAPVQGARSRFRSPARSVSARCSRFQSRLCVYTCQGSQSEHGVFRASLVYTWGLLSCLHGPCRPTVLLDGPDQQFSHGLSLLARPSLVSYVSICKFYKQWIMMSVSQLCSVLIGLVRIQPGQRPINSVHIHLYCEPSTTPYKRQSNAESLLPRSSQNTWTLWIKFLYPKVILFAGFFLASVSSLFTSL
jgi:hypothetical protein